MPTPIQPKIIAVKVANANIGEYVVVRNLTTGQMKTDRIAGTDRNVIINSASDFTWNEGDIIQAEIHGRLQGAAQTTINKGGANIILSASTDTASPGVTL